jgi:ketosteroid isomerase-like protein
MGDAENRAGIQALAAAIDAGDRNALDRLFTEDVVLEWPQSGERIVGNANRREIYARFPSLPRVKPRRIEGVGDLWVLEAQLDYGDGDPFLCVFVFRMRDGRVANEVAYWSKPFAAPEWRAPFVERMS